MATESVLLLRHRRLQIADELKKLDEQATALKAEDLELETAERVPARFVPGGAPI